MDILNQLETQPIPIEEEEKRHTRRLLVGVVCALVLTGLVFGGYIFLRKRHERQVAAATQVEVQKKTAKVEVSVDDAVVNGNKTVLGGTVQNISNEVLQNIAVELQLRRRVGSGVDTETITPESTDLAAWSPGTLQPRNRDPGLHRVDLCPRRRRKRSRSDSLQGPARERSAANGVARVKDRRG